MTKRVIETHRLQRIENRIQELEKSVTLCDSKSISRAYILGEEKTTLKDAERITRLIAQFELDCGCFIKA